MIVVGFFTFAVAFGVTLIVTLQLPALSPLTPLLGATTTQTFLELALTLRTTFEPDAIATPALEAMLLAEITFPFFTWAAEVDALDEVELEDELEGELDGAVAGFVDGPNSGTVVPPELELPEGAGLDVAGAVIANVVETDADEKLSVSADVTTITQSPLVIPRTCPVDETEQTAGVDD